MSKWIIIKDSEAHDEALKLARGTYQRDLLEGRENLSGSTLKGKAADYKAHYMASQRHFFSRLRNAGIPVSEKRGKNNKRILVIG